MLSMMFFFFFQAEDGIRDLTVTGVQTCALPIYFRPLPVESAGDELSELTRALNGTAAHLEQTIRSLTDERNRSSAILRSMVEGVAVISAEERILFSNQAFSQILGLDLPQCEGRRVGEVTRELDLLGGVKQVLAKREDRKSTRLNSSHSQISYALFCLK